MMRLLLVFFVLSFSMVLRTESFVDGLPELSEVQERVNKRYDELFTKDKNGDLAPYVCTICDEFILQKENVKVLTLSKLKGAKKLLSWKSMPDERRSKHLENSFKFYGALDGVPGDTTFLSELALSPRAQTYRKSTHGNARLGFPCCSRCKSALDSKAVPRFAIINKNYVGSAPKCLRDLTEVELALLTPVKNHGYCFTYSSSILGTRTKQHQLKGTLTFMRVEKRGIAKAVTKLEDMGFTKNILVLFTGRMTGKQKQRAVQKTTIRVEKVINALEWLCLHNSRWSDVDIDEMRNELIDKSPVVTIDHSVEVEAEQSNVEEQELFTCYYPEGATNPTAGGFDEPGAFKTYVEDMQKKGFDIEFKMELQREFVKGDDSDMLINSCLLQFPYGIGGMDERRKKADGSHSTQMDLQEYLDHVSRLSEKVFQKPLFQLIMYSLISKFRLLNMSRLQLRKPIDAKNLAEGVNAKDISTAISFRRNGIRTGGTNVSRKLLDSVDAMSRNLPHTNEAAKKARGTGEAMQHHFGMCSIFLTVTFDDENSFLIQVLCGEDIDDGTPVSTLTDEEVAERGKQRIELRINFPGLAALNFEMLYRIVLEEVVGWDIVNDRPTEKPGHFGECYAFSHAIEEQGRKTLHSHMTLWISGYRKVQNDVFFGKGNKKKTAELILERYADHVSSTALFPGTQSLIKSAFDHDCLLLKSQRSVPLVITDQGLRNLRHKNGYKKSNGVFASCPDCTKTWTYEELVADYLSNSKGISVAPIFDINATAACVPSKSKYGGLPKARMFAEIVYFQMKGEEVKDTPVAFINAAYQHHVSCHVKGCFKCQKGKGHKKHVCGPTSTCECRYRLPDRFRSTASVRTEFDGKAKPWYAWDGSAFTQPIIQILPKRRPYDLFQNVSCNAISQTKLSCNSNVSLVTDGPIGAYQHKYQLKPNRDDEQAEYATIEADMKKLKGRVHESDRSEALRLICRAAFAHNKSAVISPAFASYLLRNESRFYFSHEFIWCPLGDVIRLHNKEDVNALVKHCTDGASFFENSALHYLCRHKKLEKVSLKQFTEKYYSTFVPKENDDEDVLPFQGETAYYQHPSVLKKGRGKGKCRQGVGLRDQEGYVKVPQWLFPDTATFIGNLIDSPGTAINKDMETYSQAVLTLLYPHRGKSDLTDSPGGPHRFPYTMKLRQIHGEEERKKKKRKSPVLFTDANTQFLQNIQNSRANSLRYKVRGDELSRMTQPFEDELLLDDNGNVLTPDDDEEEEEEETPYETFLFELEQECGTPDITDSDPLYLNTALRNFKFAHHRNKGSKDCGYSGVFEGPSLPQSTSSPFLRLNVPVDDDTTRTKEAFVDTRPMYTVDDIVEVLLMRNRAKTAKTVWKDKSINVAPATGTIKSIREWSKASMGSDLKQQRAFEAITASFLLTFYEETPEFQNTATGATRGKYRQSQKALLRLMGSEGDPQLICLLHGPGGSGKSTVINTVKAYARDFCEQLGHPFTSRTICVTAMSGVAATLLHGETTHSALHLNANGVKATEADEWKDARLLIIDEISFAAPGDITKMHDRACSLMRDDYKHYGGLNIVFAGDFSQLKPVRKDTLYEGDDVPEFHGLINSYIELDGTWRFKDDPIWGERLRRFREGKPTSQDIMTINSACSVQLRHAPPGIQIATHTNKDRDAINSGIFEELCRNHTPPGAQAQVFESAVVILMDDLQMNNSAKTYVPVTSNLVKRHFYEHVGESDCKIGDGRGRVDPVLKLYRGCPMMLTLNTDVPAGEANGSRVHVQHVQAKVGETAFKLKLDCGTIVNALYASQVHHVRVKHENEDITPQEFDIECKTFRFKSTMKIGSEDLLSALKGNQFPIISNSCTTGHKLQGCTVLNLLVNDFFYGGNWAYVVLSRVKTMAGLYIRTELSSDLKKYAMPEEMTSMIQHFRDTLLLNTFTADQYKILEDLTDFILPASFPT